MMLAIFWTLSYFWSVGLTVSQYSCENNARYRIRKICTILDVYPDNYEELTDSIFPNETNIEFNNAHLREVGPELFELLEDTEVLSFNDGFVRSVFFESTQLLVLKIINTGLTDFDVLDIPNYSLEKLVIHSNVFSHLHPSIAQLKELVTLDIADCNFTYITLDWLEPLSKLRVLDVSRNYLMMLSSGPAVRLDALEELYLANNRLQFLWRFPDAYPKLKMVKFSENRWLCDWVTMARESIWIMNMISMDSDYSCSRGWILDGGLCCVTSWPKIKKVKECANVIEYSNVTKNYQGATQQTKESTERSLDVDVQNVELDLILIEGNNETEDLAIGVEMGNITVFVDDPLRLD